MDQEPSNESIKDTRKKISLTLEPPASTGPTTENLLTTTYTRVEMCKINVRSCPANQGQRKNQ